MSGIVILRQVVQGPAPSTLAASYSSVGTPCIDAIMVSTALPTPHKPIRTSAVLIYDTSESQSGGLAIPANRSKRSSQPVCPFRKACHTKTAEIVGTMYGI